MRHCSKCHICIHLLNHYTKITRKHWYKESISNSHNKSQQGSRGRIQAWLTWLQSQCTWQWVNIAFVYWLNINLKYVNDKSCEERIIKEVMSNDVWIVLRIFRHKLECVYSNLHKKNLLEGSWRRTCTNWWVKQYLCTNETHRHFKSPPPTMWVWGPVLYHFEASVPLYKDGSLHHPGSVE